MSLKVKDLVRIMESYAPLKLKEDYDNVGLMVGDKETEITSILVALDCTMEVIDEAIERNCNMILTHHPLLYLKPKSITTETLKGRKIFKLIKNDISLYSSHTNLDSTLDGVNDMAVKLLGYNNGMIMERSKVRGYEENSGIGRMITFAESITLKELCEKVKDAFDAPGLRYAGDGNKNIKKVAVINGSGEDFFSLAKNMGADCIITGDTTYHYVSDISEEGVAVIDAGHFQTEWAAMKLVAEKVVNELRRSKFNNEVIISNKSKSPYKTL